MNKRLYRSRRDTFLSGVCGGIAEYFGFDVSLVRIGWVIATLATGGIGFIAYIIAAVVVPLEPMGGTEHMDNEPRSTDNFRADTGAQQSRTESRTENHYTSDSGDWRRDVGSGRRYTGLFLILLGVFFMVRRYIPAIDFSMLWAVCLVIVGFGLMTRRR